MSELPERVLCAYLEELRINRLIETSISAID